MSGGDNPPVGILLCTQKDHTLVEYALAGMDRQAQVNILAYLRNRIATHEDPRRFGDPLRKNLSGFYRYRVGPYRVICEIQDGAVMVRVVRIGHSKSVYD